MNLSEAKQTMRSHGYILLKEGAYEDIRTQIANELPDFDYVVNSEGEDHDELRFVNGDGLYFQLSDTAENDGPSIMIWHGKNVLADEPFSSLEEAIDLVKQYL